MKKTRFLMVFAIAMCGLFSAGMFYGLFCLFSNLEESLQRGGLFTVIIAAHLLGIGAGGYSYLTIGAFRALKRELKLAALKEATSGDENDYE